MTSDELEALIQKRRQQRDLAFLDEARRLNQAIEQGARVYYRPIAFRGQRKRKYLIKHILWEDGIDGMHDYWFQCRAGEFACSFFKEQWVDILAQAQVTQHPTLLPYRKQKME